MAQVVQDLKAVSADGHVTTVSWHEEATGDHSIFLVSDGILLHIGEHWYHVKPSLPQPKKALYKSEQGEEFLALEVDARKGGTYQISEHSGPLILSGSGSIEVNNSLVEVGHDEQFVVVDGVEYREGDTLNLNGRTATVRLVSSQL